MQSNLIQGKTWKYTCVSAIFALSPGGISLASKPINNYFFVCYSSVGLLNVSNVEYQSQMIWEPLPQVTAIKDGC